MTKTIKMENRSNQIANQSNSKPSVLIIIWCISDRYLFMHHLIPNLACWVYVLTLMFAAPSTGFMPLFWNDPYIQSGLQNSCKRIIPVTANLNVQCPMQGWLFKECSHCSLFKCFKLDLNSFGYHWLGCPPTSSSRLWMIIKSPRKIG
jgi:hypothetical protein